MNDARTTLGSGAYTPFTAMVATVTPNSGDERGVEPGQAGSHDADVTPLYQRRPLDLNWLQYGIGAPFVAAPLS